MDIKIKFMAVGNTRWKCEVQVHHRAVKEFKSWLEENLQGRYMLTYLYEANNETGVYSVYELRGGDTRDKMLTVLRWA